MTDTPSDDCPYEHGEKVQAFAALQFERVCKEAELLNLCPQEVDAHMAVVALESIILNTDTPTEFLDTVNQLLTAALTLAGAKATLASVLPETKH